jgi:hypothetical protein
VHSVAEDNYSTTALFTTSPAGINSKAQLRTARTRFHIQTDGVERPWARDSSTSFGGPIQVDSI